MAAKTSKGSTPTFADLTEQLKHNMEASERLRLRRKEIKSSLTKEGIPDQDEITLAEELLSVSTAISSLDREPKQLCEQMATI